jgi:hypothetical protein
MTFFMKELVKSFLGDEVYVKAMKDTIARISGGSGVHRRDMGKKT